MLKYVAFGLLGAIIALIVYVRLMPLNGANWHGIKLPVGPTGEMRAAGSFTVVRDEENATLALQTLNDIILKTPRTQRIAGSVDEGRMTYVTRSRTMGFPDYTTITAVPPDAARGRTEARLVIFGRLRFGKADLGVNRARIQGWLEQFDKDMETR